MLQRKLIKLGTNFGINVIPVGSFEYLYDFR